VTTTPLPVDSSSSRMSPRGLVSWSESVLDVVDDGSDDIMSVVAEVVEYVDCIVRVSENVLNCNTLDDDDERTDDDDGRTKASTWLAAAMTAARTMARRLVCFMVGKMDDSEVKVGVV